MDEEQMQQKPDKEKWVYDSSLDYNGRIPLRASTGSWKTSLFIIGVEISERMSYYGIGTSLIMYLTKVMQQDVKTAAKNVNYWIGVTTIIPLFGGFLADAYLGRFYAVLASSFVYLLGLVLLTMARGIPSLKACNSTICAEPRRIHEIFFFLAIYLISVGTGGHKPSLESFGADQFDDDHPTERKRKMSFFNLWNMGLCLGVVPGVTVIVYVQDHVSWAAGDIILAAVMAFTIIVFFLGRPLYRFRKPKGSPLTPLLQVLAAAIANRNLPYPSEPDQLYEVAKSDHRLLFRTKKLKFLDKAAVIPEGHNSVEKHNPWQLATVTQVEEMKLLINMIPIWLATIPFGICVAQISTFFVKQGTTLDRRLTHNFTIPPASTFVLASISMILSIVVYEKVMVPLVRKITGNERGISILTRVGIGMIFTVVAMVVAALVETKRLKVVERNPDKGSISMSIWWLAPQFVIMGIADSFALVGLQEYFYDQVPDTMRSLGMAFFLSAIGAASFVSSLLITAVDHITEKLHGTSWFGRDLNSSRLDYFYWLLAGIAAANLCMYTLLARRYSYKNIKENNYRALNLHCYH